VHIDHRPFPTIRMIWEKRGNGNRLVRMLSIWNLVSWEPWNDYTSAAIQFSYENEKFFSCFLALREHLAPLHLNFPGESWGHDFCGMSDREFDLRQQIPIFRGLAGDCLIINLLPPDWLGMKSFLC
jgi:hypothetical protein